MKILVAADFYTEFELYETEFPEDLIEQATSAYMDGAEIDTNKHRIIGSHDSMTAEEARDQADKIIFTSELEEDPGRMVRQQATEEETAKKAGELLILLEADRNEWKHDWMKDICKLCAEYLTLDGLEDATRAAEIPEEILDIAESVLG